MSILNEAAFVKAPLEGRVIQLPITTSSQRFEIPAGWAGQYVRARAFHGTLGSAIRIDVVFGDGDVSATANQDSAVASEVITVNDASGEAIVNGELVPMVLPSIGTDTGQATHFAAIGSAAGKLQLVRG